MNAFSKIVAISVPQCNSTLAAPRTSRRRRCLVLRWELCSSATGLHASGHIRRPDADDAAEDVIDVMKETIGNGKRLKVVT